MKEVKMYKCEICNNVYETVNKAVKCESAGKEEPLYKVGDFVEHDIWVGGGYGLVGTETLMVGKVTDEGHYIKYELFEEYDGEWIYPSYSYYGNDDINKEINTGKFNSVE